MQSCVAIVTNKPMQDVISHNNASGILTSDRIVRVWSLANEIETLPVEHQIAVEYALKYMTNLGVPSDKQGINILLEIKSFEERGGSVFLTCDVVGDVDGHYKNTNRKDGRLGWLFI